MLKDIIVNLSIEAGRDVGTEFAIYLARQFGSHVEGVAFAYEPNIGLPVPIGTAATVVQGFFAEYRDRAARAGEAFTEQAKAAGIAFNTQQITAEIPDAADIFARLARTRDLAVVVKPMPEDSVPTDILLQAALFTSGRPVIVVPHSRAADAPLDRILIGWDGGPAAARAVGDAMPLLKRAKSVSILTIMLSGDEGHKAEGLVRHLKRHGVTADASVTVAPDMDVGSIMLSYAADVSADMIVMGAYGHSRFREFLLGGATRSILPSMTVPTLMSH